MAWAEPLDFGTQVSWPDGTVIGNNPARRNADSNSSSTNGNQMRTFIADLAPHLPNVVLFGVVLSKQSPRSVVSRKYPNTQRYVFSFVLRDSVTDFINISCWGAGGFIKELANSFKIADIVVVKNPLIQAKQSSDFEAEDRFKPSTSSSFQLSLSENHSSIQLYTGSDVDQFQSLLHQPIKEGNDYYTLEDVIANGQELSGQHINLLVLVKSVGNVKDIVTKDGRNIHRCEVKVFDDTYLNFSIIMWDISVIEQTYTWVSKDTVLFFADVLIKFDNFRMCMTATVDSKTIIITNPDSPEAHSLYRYGQGCSDSILNDPDNQPSDDLDLSTIQDVYTIHQLNQRCEEVKSGKQQAVVYGIVYAALTCFNLDGPLHTVISYRCASCKRRVNRQTGLCSNTECTVDTSDDSPVPVFDMNLAISDHTGTIDSCRLGGSVAERVLECTAADFCMMDDEEKTEKKWKYLLEMCKVFFKLSPAMRDSGLVVMIRVLSCSRADQQEAASYIQ
ncbi:meiosis-specific with OB domain-containing protein-like [Anneissia japonica]|uniref:meiosis-specific with OB domain-containing protein-like n=1 Tax=Anneissia japonica TaxID=1529436 RepID=UPI0014254D6D|nr:meiosis-specific with OB domain-containing protein-like [Anneissia japonica]